MNIDFYEQSMSYFFVEKQGAVSMTINLLTEVLEINASPELGTPSKFNKTSTGKHTYDIPFALKPSQQILAALGNPNKLPKPPYLTQIKGSNIPQGSNIEIKSFDPAISGKITLTWGAFYTINEQRQDLCEYRHTANRKL